MIRSGGSFCGLLVCSLLICGCKSDTPRAATQQPGSTDSNRFPIERAMTAAESVHIATRLHLLADVWAEEMGFVPPVDSSGLIPEPYYSWLREWAIARNNKDSARMRALDSLVRKSLGPQWKPAEKRRLRWIE